MDLMVQCERCGKIVNFDSYFGAYICKCGWRDDSYDQERVKKEEILSSGKINHMQLTSNDDLVIKISAKKNDSYD